MFHEKCNRFKYPTEHLKRIFKYLARNCGAELSKIGHLQYSEAIFKAKHWTNLVFLKMFFFFEYQIRAKISFSISTNLKFWQIRIESSYKISINPGARWLEYRNILIFTWHTEKFHDRYHTTVYTTGILCWLVLLLLGLLGLVVYFAESMLCLMYVRPALMLLSSVC